MANLTDEQLRDIVQGRVQVTSCAAVDIATELLALREDKARLDSRRIVIPYRGFMGEMREALHLDIDIRAAIDAAREDPSR